LDARLADPRRVHRADRNQRRLVSLRRALHPGQVRQDDAAALEEKRVSSKPLLTAERYSPRRHEIRHHAVVSPSREPDATRRRHISVRLVTSLLLLVAIGACSSTSESSLPTIAGPAKCRDTASCTGGFTLNGVGYVLGCAGIEPDRISGDVLATGTYGETSTEVRRIEGVDPGVVVALRRPGGVCGDRDPVRSPWTAAIRIGPGNEQAVQRSVCAVIDAAEKARNRCGK